MQRRAWIVVLGLSALACRGDDGPASASEAGDDGSETSGDETGDETGEAGPLLVGEPTIVRHPEQPMVVDVLVELDAPSTGELVHTGDSGVGVFQLSPAPGEAATTLHYRLRGLLPDAEHPLELHVNEAAGERSETWTGAFTSDPALPGFIATFEIDTDDAELVSGDRRLFDLAQMFSSEPAGVYLVDADGRTRWYLGDADDYTDTTDIWAGLRLRADGSISFTRRLHAYVVDELGEIVMDYAGEELGVPGGVHHDMEELPNGNFMALAFTFADVAYEGEGTLRVAGDMLVEFTPAGEVVWTWNSFDHLDPQRRRDGFYDPPGVFDPVNQVDAYDWTHANGLVYDAVSDTVYVSLRHQDWVLAIDHATGELLWRLGDEGDFELIGDEYWFFHQHSIQWQPDGSLLLYDNAVGNPARPDAEAHSRAVRYELDLDAMTATKVWADDDPFFTSALAGDADRMSNGSILRLDSIFTNGGNSLPTSRMHELDPARTPNLVWSLTVPPGRFSYRAVPVTRWVGEPIP